MEPTCIMFQSLVRVAIRYDKQPMSCKASSTKAYNPSSIQKADETHHTRCNDTWRCMQMAPRHFLKQRIGLRFQWSKEWIVTIPLTFAASSQGTHSLQKRWLILKAKEKRWQMLGTKWKTPTNSTLQLTCLKEIPCALLVSWLSLEQRAATANLLHTWGNVTDYRASCWHRSLPHSVGQVGRFMLGHELILLHVEKEDSCQDHCVGVSS